MKKLKRVTSGLVASSLAALSLATPNCKRSSEMPPNNSSFDPSENEPEDVYGPPEWFDRGPEGYDPSENIPVAVYGPPEWFSDAETSAAMDVAPQPPAQSE